VIIRTVLLACISAFAIVFIVLWRRKVTSPDYANEDKRPPSLIQLAIGFVTNFLDTLGIGSFATTTAAYKMFKVVRDERLVGTMLIGDCLIVVVQAFIFLNVVPVDPSILIPLTVAAILGGWLGAGLACRLPRAPIQICIGIGLIVAASFMLMSQLEIVPGAGTSMTLSSGKLAIALVANFIIGFILMLGIGSYAPSLVLFSLLGMDPRAAFPIMMGTGALMAMIGATQFIQAGRFENRAALGLTLGGIPAVLIAGLIVKSLPLGVLRWMVVFVVIYAATMMLRSAMAERRSTVVANPVM
jgi:uncharacterized membrane protein YfcA